MSRIYSIVLAAGKGTRMKSKLPKVLHKIGGKPMVGHVVELMQGFNCDKIIVVVGHGAEQVEEYLGDSALYVEQEQQLGTGHAVLQTESMIGKEQGITIVLTGDTPLLTEDTIEALINEHSSNNNSATILTTEIDQPTGYGRIIRNEKLEVTKIVEEKDASEEIRKIKEINSGIYCFDNQKLFKALKKLKPANAQGEYYLTDVIEIMRSEGDRIGAYKTLNANETIGINDRITLEYAESILKNSLLDYHMTQGVTIIDRATTHIEKGVIIGEDTVIYPGTHLRGNTIIGTDCVIGPNVEMNSAEIGAGVTISHSVINSSIVQNNAIIGPFAYIRPGSHIGESVKIGDFVEIKNSTIGKKTKVPHHSYIGDAKLGEEINIGCGTITVNYDGQSKHQTVIEDKVFVGCNSNLVAPVKIGNNAYIAAGSTITENVPAAALAIARQKQTNKENYVDILKKKKAPKP